MCEELLGSHFLFLLNTATPTRRVESRDFSHFLEERERGEQRLGRGRAAGEEGDGGWVKEKQAWRMRVCVGSSDNSGPGCFTCG